MNATRKMLRYLNSSARLLAQRRELHGKLHREYENEYFHGVLESFQELKHSVISQPNKTMVREFFGAAAASTVDPTRRFVDLSVQTNGSGSTIESREHGPLIQDIVASLPRASHGDLKCLLTSLCLWPQTEATTTPQFKLLWNALDKECSARCSEWDYGRQLLFADCFYHLRLSRITKYNRTVLRSLGRFVTKLTVRELMQYLFYSNLQRWMVQRTKPIIEARLLASFNRFSVAEVGLLCQSFFKCQEIIKDSVLVERIVKSLEQNASQAHSIVVSSIAKALRYSRFNQDTVRWERALVACEPVMAEWSPSTVSQVTALATALKSYHPGLLDVGLQYLMTNLSTVRLKEITRTLRALAVFNHQPNGIGEHYKSILRELLSSCRKAEVEAYHHTFVSAAWYLAVAGVYSADLVAMALDESRIHGSRKHADISFHAEALQSSVRVEFPQYDGPFLSQKALESLCTERHLTGRDLDTETEKLVYREKVTLDVANRLRGKYSDVFSIKRTLPHHHYPDVLFNMEDGPEVKVSKCEVDLLNGAWRPQQCSTKHPCAVVLHGPGSYRTGSSTLMGIENMKVRQLKLLGYRVIEVPHSLPSQMSVAAFDCWFEQQLLSHCKPVGLEACSIK